MSDLTCPLAPLVLPFVVTPFPFIMPFWILSFFATASAIPLTLRPGAPARDEADAVDSMDVESLVRLALHSEVEKPQESAQEQTRQ